MKVDILTLFPGMFTGPLQESILKRAQAKEQLRVNVHNLRQWTTDKHHTADDRPFGGGPGMVMKPEPIFAGVESLQLPPQARVILTSPRGHRFSQSMAMELSQCEHLVLICGHYEGIDERVAEHIATDVLSIGDFVLTGGELPALVMLDAVVRLLPDVLGNQDSAAQDSFMDHLLDCAHYTRPAVFRGWSVPPVLMSGDHAAIARWRRRDQLHTTRTYRPDLLAQAPLSVADQRLLQQKVDDAL